MTKKRNTKTIIINNGEQNLERNAMLQIKQGVYDTIL